MKLSEYKDTKLAIYEKAANGEITDDNKVQLLAMLEAKKDEETLTQDDIDKFFKNLTDMYPDLEKDVEKLSKKIEKAAGGDDSSDDSEDKGSDDKAADEAPADDAGSEEDAPVSERAMELLEMVQNL